MPDADVTNEWQEWIVNDGVVNESNDERFTFNLDVPTSSLLFPLLVLLLAPEGLRACKRPPPLPDLLVLELALCRLRLTSLSN